MRVQLCSASNPKGQLVLLKPSTSGLTELLKTAKSKLKMKKTPKSAQLVDKDGTRTEVLQSATCGSPVDR